MKEIWKDISGFEGFYQISNLGRIKSFKQSKDGKIMSQTNKKGDYFRIVLRTKHKTKSAYIHRIVVETFLGVSTKGMCVHHKDGNKQNNAVYNLECITSKEHRKIHIYENPNICNGMIKYNQKIRPKKIVQKDFDENIINIFNNAKEAHDFTGVCARNILQVASRDPYKPGKTRKQAGGYIWEFLEEGDKK